MVGVVVVIVVVVVRRRLSWRAESSAVSIGVPLAQVWQAARATVHIAGSVIVYTEIKAWE